MKKFKYWYVYKQENGKGPWIYIDHFYWENRADQCIKDNSYVDRFQKRNVEYKKRYK